MERGINVFDLQTRGNSNTTVFVIIRKFLSMENEGDVVKRVGTYATRLSVIDSGTFLVDTQVSRSGCRYTHIVRARA